MGNKEIGNVRQSHNCACILIQVFKSHFRPFFVYFCARIVSLFLECHRTILQ